MSKHKRKKKNRPPEHPYTIVLWSQHESGKLEVGINHVLAPDHYELTEMLDRFWPDMDAHEVSVFLTEGHLTRPQVLDMLCMLRRMNPLQREELVQRFQNLHIELLEMN